MWWWEEATEDFKRWLESVFGPSSEKEQQQISDFQRLAAGPTNPNVKLPQSAWDRKVEPVLTEYDKKNPLKASTPSPSSTPAATPAPAPTPGSNAQQQQQWLAGVVAQALPEWVATQRQSQGTINGVDPKAPVWDPRIKKTQIGPVGDFAPKVTKMETRTLDDIIRDPYGWDDKKLKAIGEMMFNANLIGQGDILNRDKIANQWAVIASTSARMFELGKKNSPMDILKRMSYGLAGGAGGSPKTVTDTTTQYSVTNATTARQLAQAALSTRLGRKATDSEVAEFVSALRAEEKKNPTVQTTTTTTNADGTSRTSTATTREGLNPNAFADQYSMNYNTEEAKAYQAAGYYAPIFFEALKAPV